MGWVVEGGVEVVVLVEAEVRPERLRNRSRPRSKDLGPEAELVASAVEAGASSGWAELSLDRDRFGLKVGRLFRKGALVRGASGLDEEVGVTAEASELASVEASGLNIIGFGKEGNLQIDQFNCFFLYFAHFFWILLNRVTTLLDNDNAVVV